MIWGMVKQKYMKIRIMETLEAVNRAEDMVTTLGWQQAVIQCSDFMWMNRNEKNYDESLYWMEVRDEILKIIESKFK